MKITAERLRQIITEEVIKEELAPEIAAPAIAAMLQGTEAAATSDIFGAVFDQMYGEGALEDEAERMANAEEPEEEGFPTEYQPGGGEGDRPVMGFKENLQAVIMEELRSVLAEAAEIPDLAKAGPELEELIQQVLPGIEKASQGNENLKKLALQRVFQLLQQEGDVQPMQEGVENIIEQEYYIYMIEKEYGLLSEVWGSEKAQAVASSKVLRPTQISPIDKYPGFQEILDDPTETDRGLISAAEMAKEQYEFLQQLAAASAEQIRDIDVYWQKYLNLGGSLRDVIEIAPENADIVGSLEKLYQRLRNRQEHDHEASEPQ